MRSGAEFDYIIVGAGSAGCVLANRLSADPSVRVLVLEAGPWDRGWKIHMPAALTYNLMNDRYNWYYKTEPQRHLDDRQLYWPRGRHLHIFHHHRVRSGWSRTLGQSRSN